MGEVYIQGGTQKNVKSVYIGKPHVLPMLLQAEFVVTPNIGRHGGSSHEYTTYRRSRGLPFP